MSNSVGICGDRLDPDSRSIVAPICRLDAGHTGLHHCGLIDWRDKEPTVTAKHVIYLRQPERDGNPTTATCGCNWSVTYGWGGHREAQRDAEGHIEDHGADYINSGPDSSGHVVVMEGFSL